MRNLGLVLLAIALSGSSAVAAQDRFTFHDASFLPPARGEAEAQAFVAEAFPPGLSLAEAERRVEAAGMRCRPARSGGLACLYSEPQAEQTGLIGEDAWSLRLASGPSGGLATADLRRGFIGADEPNPQ